MMHKTKNCFFYMRHINIGFAKKLQLFGSLLFFSCMMHINNILYLNEFML